MASPFEKDLIRIFKTYIQADLKNSIQMQQTGQFDSLTLDSVIESSKMGNQNPVIKEALKEYVSTHSDQLLSIPVLDKQKEIFLNAKRKRIAIKRGRYIARKGKGQKIPKINIGGRQVDAIIAEQIRLTNLNRVKPYSNFFSTSEINRIENLPYILSRMHMRKDGIITMQYRKKTLTQKQLMKMLGA